MKPCQHHIGGQYGDPIGGKWFDSIAPYRGEAWAKIPRAISYMMPFGGMKHSSIGRESGIEAIREHLETRSVRISMAEGSPANPFVMR